MVRAPDRTGDDFTGRDTDRNSQSGRQTGRELRYRSLYLQSGPHGALGIIAASERRSEQRHRRVADVLVNRPSKAVDSCINKCKEALQQGMDLFGIEHRREAGVDQPNAENHRTTASLRSKIPLSADRPNPFAAKRMTAAAAKALGRLVRKTAILAGYRQRRAAGRAEFASRSILQLAFIAAHRVGLPCP